MRWVEHLIHIEEKENTFRFFGGGYLKERDHLEELGPHPRTVLMWILNKCDRRAWMRSSWLSTGTSGGLL
jgi:hypothetical protein